MAKDNLTTDEEQKEELAEKTMDEKAGEKKKFGGKAGKIFLIVGILLLQGVGAYFIVSTYYPEMYGMMNSMNPEGGVYFSIENLIINPAKSEGERYLILSITAELTASGELNTLETRHAEVVDRVNTVLTQRTVSELNDINDRKEVKREIGIVINEVLNKKSVRNLFFTKFVLQ